MERAELQQVFIAGDDERGVGGEPAGEHLVIVGIGQCLHIRWQ